MSGFPTRVPICRPKSGRPTNGEKAIADPDTNLEQGWVVRRNVQALVDVRCRLRASMRILDVDKLTSRVGNEILRRAIFSAMLPEMFGDF